VHGEIVVSIHVMVARYIGPTGSCATPFERPVISAQLALRSAPSLGGHAPVRSSEKGLNPTVKKRFLPANRE
jgi:hypothetical protein